MGRGVRDMIVNDIVRGLYEGRYEPGQRLPESLLTSTYGVSRAPAREALSVLANMNLVVIEPQCGARIRVLTIGEAIDTLIVAQTLIGLAARLASGRCDSDAAARVNAAVAAIREHARGDSDANFAKARDRFYATINDLADNCELKHLLPLVRVHLIRVQFRFLLRSQESRSLADYAHIAKAIVNCQPTQAENAVRTHLGHAIRALEEYIARS